MSDDYEDDYEDSVPEEIDVDNDSNPSCKEAKQFVSEPKIKQNLNNFIPIDLPSINKKINEKSQIQPNTEKSNTNRKKEIGLPLNKLIMNNKSINISNNKIFLRRDEVKESIKFSKVNKSVDVCTIKKPNNFFSSILLLKLEPIIRRYLGISSNDYKGTRVVKKLETELNARKERHAEILIDYNAEFDSMNFCKKINYLKNESKELRNELRKFNDMISNLLGLHSPCNNLNYNSKT